MVVPAPPDTSSDLPVSDPHVSVIVPIYNGVADLPGLEACLLSQTYAPKWVEYLLVDNNSQDATPERLRAFADKAAQQSLRVQPLTEAAIQSSYAARNRGICAASGEILVFTDMDCRPEPDWLAQLVSPFADPSVAMVAGEIKALAGDTWLEQYAEQAETLSQKHTLAHSFYPYGQTANLAVRRQLLEKTGLFRPYLTTGGDADLCWRLQQAGCGEIVFAEQAVVRHRHRHTLGELQSQWRRYGKSNQYLHELHGIPLMRKISPREIRYRLARWALKELPITSRRVLMGQCPAIALLETPLDLYCQHARWSGQQQAALPPNARTVEPFPQTDAVTNSSQPSPGAPRS